MNYKQRWHLKIVLSNVLNRLKNGCISNNKFLFLITSYNFVSFWCLRYFWEISKITNLSKKFEKKKKKEKRNETDNEKKDIIRKKDKKRNKSNKEQKKKEKCIFLKWKNGSIINLSKF